MFRQRMQVRQKTTEARLGRFLTTTARVRPPQVKCRSTQGMMRRVFSCFHDADLLDHRWGADKAVGSDEDK